MFISIFFNVPKLSYLYKYTVINMQYETNEIKLNFTLKT